MAPPTTEKVVRVGVADLKKYFGLKPGETLKEFAAESKALTDEDFCQLRDGIQNGSLTY